MDELLLLVLEDAQPAGVMLGLAASDEEPRVDLLADVGPDRVALLGTELDAAVMALDGSLGGIDGDVLSAAGGGVRILPRGNEVLRDLVEKRIESFMDAPTRKALRTLLDFSDPRRDLGERGYRTRYRQRRRSEGTRP